jgi:hypothetical protein
MVRAVDESGTSKLEGECYFLRSEAIDFAKLVLRLYEVPFCNRIKGSGLEDNDRG